jgi:hypothetical protein
MRKSPDQARIKALTSENRNLKAKLRDLQQGHQDAMASASGMSFATQSAIANSASRNIPLANGVADF